ncbi:hypothetical protein WR37_23225 [Vibrio parahaemolyticus]|nr:hypothetical protein WR37_23225 [Vibrio parahaemolyticus]
MFGCNQVVQAPRLMFVISIKTWLSRFTTGTAHPKLRIKKEHAISKNPLNIASAFWKMAVLLFFVQLPGNLVK